MRDINIFNNIKLIRSFTKYFVTLIMFWTFLFSPILIAESSVSSISEVQTKPDEKTIRIVMSAAFVSEEGVDVYSDIFNYLGNKLGRKVEFVSGFSYSTINKMLDTGMVDVGFVCGLPYTIKMDVSQPTIDLLLAPVMIDPKYNSKPIYYSYIIVHKNSKYKKFSDLKESHFVFNDEISNSGYNMPRAHLIDIGETTGFFSEISRSGSHEESIRLVALSKADVSAVDSLVYDYDVKNNPKYVKDTKIIKVLGPVGIPPIVVSTKTSLSVKNEMRKVLLQMNTNAIGKKILSKALVDRFVVVEDSNYDSIRKMNKKSIISKYRVIH